MDILFCKAARRGGAGIPRGNVLCFGGRPFVRFRKTKEKSTADRVKRAAGHALLFHLLWLRKSQQRPISAVWQKLP
ncbi:hypothetical protein [uncultured Oscillibacter sp.]|uniref:hypothetical protein n=1 Tax=uncultured Oscillibacter sp. TaxID=876091 RepID=UPI002600A296|nr:hypothetical protein [uncultured Oscillibacter sp.]